MKYSQIKEIYQELEEIGIDDKKEALTNMLETEKDFEIDNYRFINANHIDSIQQEELESDPYTLGCFNADFITDNTDLSYDIVLALQDGEKYEAIGNHVIDNNCVQAVQEEYARLDGYGHHFAHYDHETHGVILPGVADYHIFRIN